MKEKQSLKKQRKKKINLSCSNLLTVEEWQKVIGNENGEINVGNNKWQKERSRV